ncbi:MAG: EpsI family protein [Gemmataceae bacterium]|nr:EpsI family protein [Gemmataceae bacterium]
MRSLGIALILAVSLASVGFYHGLATDRWTDVISDASGGNITDQIPLTLGDWVGEILPRQEEDDRKTMIENRRYRHRLTGSWVLTSLTAGRAGRVSIHNPEHCYLGSGYQVVDSIRLETIRFGEREGTFWTGHFEKRKATGVESIRIYWGWTSDGTWEAPEYPRLYFAARPRLYKLYFIHPIEPGDSTPEALYRDFMVQFLTAWDMKFHPH